MNFSINFLLKQSQNFILTLQKKLLREKVGCRRKKHIFHERERMVKIMNAKKMEKLFYHVEKNPHLSFQSGGGVCRRQDLLISFSLLLILLTTLSILIIII